jgi:hypothetical protein
MDNDGSAQGAAPDRRVTLSEVSGKRKRRGHLKQKARRETAGLSNFSINLLVAHGAQVKTCKSARDVEAGLCLNADGLQID